MRWAAKKAVSSPWAGVCKQRLGMSLQGVTKWTPSARLQDKSDQNSNVSSTIMSLLTAGNGRPQCFLLEVFIRQSNSSCQNKLNGKETYKEKSHISLPPRPVSLPRAGSPGLTGEGVILLGTRQREAR